MPKGALAREIVDPARLTGASAEPPARAAYEMGGAALGGAPVVATGEALVKPVAANAMGASAASPAPWELVRPLRPGTRLGHGWRVAELSGVADGSCVLTLQNRRGRTQRVHLCRNDGRPQGLVYTEQCDLVVMNGGQGDLPTEEGLAQAVAAIAHALAANESGRHPVVVSLLPQAERVRRYSGTLDRTLR